MIVILLVTLFICECQRNGLLFANFADEYMCTMTPNYYEGFWVTEGVCVCVFGDGLCFQVKLINSTWSMLHWYGGGETPRYNCSGEISGKAYLIKDECVTAFYQPVRSYGIMDLNTAQSDTCSALLEMYNVDCQLTRYFSTNDCNGGAEETIGLHSWGFYEKDECKSQKCTDKNLGDASSFDKCCYVESKTKCELTND